MSRWGSGPDVVFLHGLGASSRYWETLARRSSGYRGTAPDLLGFGRSPAPPEASYDVNCHLDALEPHLPERAIVVAHSTGAILATALAAALPTRVDALLLLGLPAYPDDRVARETVGGLGVLARLTADESRFARLLCEAMCKVQPLASAIAPLVLRDVPRAVASDAARHTWISYSRTLRRVVLGHRVADDLKASRSPVSLLHGDADRSAPLEFIRSLVARMGDRQPRLAMEVTRGDHHLAIRRSDVVAHAIASMLAVVT